MAMVMVVVMMTLVIMLTMVTAGVCVAVNVAFRLLLQRFLPLHSGQPLFHCSLIELLRFPLQNFDGACGAVGKTCPQAVAVDVADQHRLAIDDLNCPFMASLYA
ncbi:hypothetical protein D3C75_889680 [compost metagenome]